MIAPGSGQRASPRATLRLQFHAGFTLDEATRHVPYFAALGVSHIYASPLLAARPGSTHGYDIIDHGRINPELGGATAFERFSDTLRGHGLGLILDFVPNHMGVGGDDNAWWLDVLEWGASSPFAAYFDIDWNPPEPSLRGKLLVPFLGAPYGEVLRKGELSLRFDPAAGSFSVWYFEHRFPVAPAHYQSLLSAAAEMVADEPDLAILAARFGALGQGVASAERMAQARDDAVAAKAELADVVARRPGMAAAIAGALATYNARPGSHARFARLHRLLERQAYRLAYWRVATDEINYRRFFDINALAGLRMEDATLFDVSHRLILDLVAAGRVDGLRLDHIDGLLDPLGYCRRLREACETARGGDVSEPFYIVVEKILAAHESLPLLWPVDGTTGYDFMGEAGGLLVDPAGMARLTRGYGRFSGRDLSYEETVEQARRQIVRNNLSAELGVLAGLLQRLAKGNVVTRDFTFNAMRLALIDIAAYFPVYRTYVGEGGADDNDRRDLDWAVARACRAPGLLDASIYSFIHAVLAFDMDRLPGQGWRREAVLHVAQKFQQFTGPVAAKSEEDTAFYRWVALVCVNEVGGHPARPTVSPTAFHHACQARLRHHPRAMLATATHDHKRGEDTRARLAVLSERPRDWLRLARAWGRINRHKRGDAGDGPAPTRNDEYLLYQTMVGAWPVGLMADDREGLAAFAKRVEAYMLKAVREAKLNSNWAAPDAAYEAAVAGFVHALFDPRRSRGFLGSVAAFVDSIVPAGIVNSLAQTVLRLTAPGVPDTYGGTEVWDFSLVDPDNRRPVPLDTLSRMLGDHGQAALAELLPRWRDGAVKQALAARLLAFRATHPRLFAEGSHDPVDVDGEQRDRAVAFRRSGEDGTLIVAVPRLVSLLMSEGDMPLVPAERWGDTRLVFEAPPAGLADVFTGAPVPPAGDGGLPLGRLFERLPFSVLFSRA